MGMSTRRPSFSSSLSMMQERGAAGGAVRQAVALPPTSLLPGQPRTCATHTGAQAGHVQRHAHVHQCAHVGVHTCKDPRWA